MNAFCDACSSLSLLFLSVRPQVNHTLLLLLLLRRRRRSARVGLGAVGEGLRRREELRRLEAALEAALEAVAARVGGGAVVAGAVGTSASAVVSHGLASGRGRRGLAAVAASHHSHILRKKLPPLSTNS